MTGAETAAGAHVEAAAGAHVEAVAGPQAEPPAGGRAQAAAGARAAHPWVTEARRTVRFAVTGAFLTGWTELRDFVTRAEQLGFDACWANDHPSRTMDCWTQLAALAAVTTRIRLMSLVSCVYYRSPVLLARHAADVDIISGGRLVLGLGTGDDADEFRRLGLSFPPFRERLAALAAAAATVPEAWTSPDGALRRPAPVQLPRIPVLIGGGGEGTLRVVARHADVSNFGPHEWTGGAFDVADVRRKCEILRRHCAEIGRPFEDILRSHYTPLLTLAETPAALERKRARARIPDAGLRTAPVFATVAEAIEHYQALADAGMQYFLANVNGHDTETVELLADQVQPALTTAN